MSAKSLAPIPSHDVFDPSRRRYLVRPTSWKEGPCEECTPAEALILQEETEKFNQIFGRLPTQERGTIERLLNGDVNGISQRALMSAVNNLLALALAAGMNITAHHLPQLLRMVV